MQVQVRAHNEAIWPQVSIAQAAQSELDRTKAFIEHIRSVESWHWLTSTSNLQLQQRLLPALATVAATLPALHAAVQLLHVCCCEQNTEQRLRCVIRHCHCISKDVWRSLSV